MLFQPCRSSSLLVTLKMSCCVSMNEINNDDDDDQSSLFVFYHAVCSLFYIVLSVSIYKSKPAAEINK